VPETPVFLFGTLRHAPLLGLVAGRPLAGEAAELAGAACELAMAGDWPVLVPRDGARANGLLIRVDDAALARLDYYEAVFGYGRETVTVETAAGPVRAEAWRPSARDPGRGAPWNLDAWVAEWGALTLETAGDIMRRMGRQTPEEVGRLANIIRARAGAVLRTRGWTRPGRRQGGLDAGAVEILSRAHPYDGFFGVEEIVARHARFDGTGPETVTRAVYRVADAATVLPYDPVRDRILLIEQVRFGPLAQGDPAPWLLEPVAGLIDGGESPEACARRETVEEAGLLLEDLHFVARYYPSPGGVAQVFYSYVGIADLPDEAATLGGHEDESEDILGHVLSFDEAVAMMEGGDIVNAAAIVTLQWLAVHRDRLRRGPDAREGSGTA
jgi:nudix-type nucleoside diphosphatase (YffH/AdpP family)